MTKLLMNMVALVFILTKEVQHLHEVVFHCFISGSQLCTWNVGALFLASTRSRAFANLSLV